jgi:hypothetical protein
MSKQLTLVYQTDNWHNNKVLIAVCEEKQVAIETIRQFVWDTYKALLTEHDEFLLNTINQTQGDSKTENPFEGEFVIESVTTNTILI